MAQTAIHAPAASYSRRGAVTNCGKATGDVTSEPTEITCNAAACADVRKRHEMKVRVAASVSESFHGHLNRPHTYETEDAQKFEGYVSEEGTTYTVEGNTVSAMSKRDAEENARTVAAAANLTATSYYFSIEGAVGGRFTVGTVEEAEALYHAAKNLADAAFRARQIIEAREYVAEYEAAKSAAVQE